MENLRNLNKSRLIALLGVIGLIIGAVGLGLGASALTELARMRTQLDAISKDTHEHNGWYKRHDSAVYTNPNFTNIPITELTITFELESNEAVYFSYMAGVTLVPESGLSFIAINFRVDGIQLLNPYKSYGVSNGSAVGHYSTITLQLYKDDLSVGIHNVTVDILGSHPGNFVVLNTLYVQKYPV